MTRATPILHRDDPEKEPLVGHVKVTREDWLNAARDVLVTEGVASVKILPLSTRLGVSRSSFYWYFENREDLLSALEKEEERQNNPDYKIKQQEDEFINQSRSEWKDRFDTNGWENMNVADIREKKGTAGMQFLKALAEKAGVSYYKNRPGARSSGRAGGGTSLGVQELQDRLIDELGIPDTVDVENFDRGLFDVLQSIEDKRSELDSAKRARRREKRELKKRELKRKK